MRARSIAFRPHLSSSQVTYYFCFAQLFLYLVPVHYIRQKPRKMRYTPPFPPPPPWSHAPCHVRSGGLAPHVSPAASASLARIAAGPCRGDYTGFERRQLLAGPIKSFLCDTNVTNRRGLKKTDREAKIP